MKLKIARISKIPVYLSDNYLMFAAVMLLMQFISGGLAGLLNVALLIFSVSVIITLHEFGHALTAKRFGARTDSITLNFYGGLAQINSYDWRMLLNKPYKGMLVWMAGPAVNVVLYGIVTLTHGYWAHTAMAGNIAYFGMINVAIAAFNLMPVFPLDGGGILYCLLAMVLKKSTAIRITSVIGVIGSVLFLVAAVKFHAIMLGIIAVMTLFTAWNIPKHEFFRG